jgi:hypothetical protein
MQANAREGTDMTAGQGPQGWDQPGQQPSGQDPYGQGSYGQGSYGQGSYGQGPYGGFASAPAAPDGFGLPAPVERPSAVTLGVGAFAATLVLSVLSSVVTFSDVDGFIDQVQQASPGVEVSESAARAGLIGGAAFALVLVALQVMFLWFAWQGRNWARVVLWVLAGLGIVSGLSGLVVGSPLPFLSALGGFQMLLLIVAVVALAMKPSSEWYRFRGWQRATGQG